MDEYPLKITKPGWRQELLYQGIFTIRRTLKPLRDQGLCVAAHLFAEEVNTESDLVGENLATKGDELYFQDLPVYNKLISLQQRGRGGGPKGVSAWKSAPKNDIVWNALNSDWLEIR